MEDINITDKLEEICKTITKQNRELIARLDKPDFKPDVELDNTRNDAAYRLTDFFDVLKGFPHGKVPCELTNDLVTSTDELLDALNTRYGADPEMRSAIIRAGQAFRNSKRTWRIKDPLAPMTPDVYSLQLDNELTKILRTLDDLNFEFGCQSREDDAPQNEPAQHSQKSPLQEIAASIDKLSAVVENGAKTVASSKVKKRGKHAKFPVAMQEAVYTIWERERKNIEVRNSRRGIPKYEDAFLHGKADFIAAGVPNANALKLVLRARTNRVNRSNEKHLALAHRK